MKRPIRLVILTLSAAILPALCLAAASVPAAETAQQEAEAAEPKTPKAATRKPLKDFGRVSKGTQLSYDWVIENQGTADLEIVEVVPDCGCTVAEYDEVIPPGGKGKVHAEIDTYTLTGPSERKIKVLTNDPANPVLVLSFQAEVTPHLGARPGFARFEVVQGEEDPGNVRQTVWAIDEGEFEILGVESTAPYLQASFRRAGDDERNDKVKQPGPQWIVDVSLYFNQAPVGALTEEVVVRTSHETQAEVHIPVSGFVRPGMWATPSEVDLGEFEIDKMPVTFVLVVQNFLAAPAEVTGVESDLAGLESMVTAVQEGRRYNVQVILNPGLPKGPFKGKLRIKTSHPSQPLVEVPMKGTVL